MVAAMTAITEPETDQQPFLIEHLNTGVHASGFGHLGDGRSFAFGIQRPNLIVAVYRAGHNDPVPHTEDLQAVVRRPLRGIDLDDERSLAAAVRDAVPTTC